LIRIKSTLPKRKKNTKRNKTKTRIKKSKNNYDKTKQKTITKYKKQK